MRVRVWVRASEGEGGDQGQVRASKGQGKGSTYLLLGQG